MISFIFSLLLIFGIQIVLELTLTSLGVTYIYVMVIVDLVLGFLFAFINYRGYKKSAIRDPLFHRNVAIYFVILLAIDLLLYFY